MVWNFFMGSTMAKNLSAESAVRVNTDTPIDMSWAVSESLHMSSPHGHDSTVYTTDVNGTLVINTSKSPSAKDNMYLKNERNCSVEFSQQEYWLENNSTTHNCRCKY